VLVWIILNIVYFATLGVGFAGSIDLSCRAKESTFPEGRAQSTFSRLWPFFLCNLSTESHSFYLGTVVLPFLISELKKSSSPGIRTKDRFSVLWSLFLGSSRRNKNFGLGAVIYIPTISIIYIYKKINSSYFSYR
jgi:hypothetical protein